MKTNLFKNDFILAPLKLGYCGNKDGKVNEKHLNFYRQRAEHLGAIIPEPFYIDAGLRENPFQLGIDNDDKIEGIAKIAEIIHQYGGKFIVHINHPGRMANAAIPGNYFWSASAIPCENGGAIPEAMNESMMNIAIEKMVNASIRAQKAGADFIEIQFGYGYLLSQFLSPQTNQRTDEYGGSFENRLKFPLQVLKSIQQSISIPIIARVSATDFQPNGINIEESILLSKRLEKEGVVAVHITIGSACSAPAWYYQHMFTQKGKTWEMADKIQKQLSIPVIFHGRIHSADDIEFLRKNYQAKYFSIGRALIADEHFVAKLLGINPEPIRPCLACSEGCLGGVRGGKGLGCVVNPRVNNDLPLLEKTQNPQKVAVVGAGLAGLEAAITLKKRGHEVVLFEKNQIGGQFQFAYLPPKKESLLEIVNFYKKEINRLQIPVEYIEATNEMLEQRHFDMAIMATGATPVVPPIKGLSQYYHFEILKNPEILQNKKVVIIGGGLIGVEIASKLLDFQNKIIIVEMLDDIARGLEMIERKMTLAKFKQHNVEIHLKSKVVEINNNTVKIETENGLELPIDNVDSIIVAVGMKSYKPFEPKLSANYVGDAQKVAKAQEAIKDAYELALNL
ncbi:MAG: FAD-dependent oxidoreductase [Marinilabiliales bacterium]